jgi:chromatin structure-remodeling complex subunit RSC3/30
VFLDPSEQTALTVVGYLSWRRVGDLISICIAKGLHGEIRPSETVPFWLSELRKRQFVVTYSLDKSSSIFLGRPPRLQRKYCSMQLPLDLDSKHLRLPALQLEDEINKLDEAGWNTEGSFRENLYARTMLICHMITEDIQELMLSTIPEHREEYALTVLSRSQDAWNNLPSFIKDAPSTPLNGVLQHYLSDAIRIAFLHNEFLLQRVLVQKLKTSNEELVLVSRNELEKVLAIFRHHRTSSRHAVDIPWFIAKYALPAAGVLAFELLRQSQGQHVGSTFHRSEVVQNLSSLVAALKWVASRQAANYDICNYARPVLQQILDIVLSPCQDHPNPQNATDLANNSEAASEFDLMNQTCSEAEFWSLLPQHPLLADYRT